MSPSTADDVHFSSTSGQMTTIDLMGSNSSDDTDDPQPGDSTPTTDHETKDTSLMSQLVTHDALLHQPRHSLDPDLLIGPLFYDTSDLNLFTGLFLLGLYVARARGYGVNGNFVVRFLSDAFGGVARMTNLIYAMDQAIASRSFLTTCKEATVAVAQLVLSTVNELIHDFERRFHSRRNDPEILYSYEAIVIQRALLQWGGMLSSIHMPQMPFQSGDAVVSLAGETTVALHPPHSFPHTKRQSLGHTRCRTLKPARLDASPALEAYATPRDGRFSQLLP